MASKKITLKQAQEMRAEKVKYYSSINPFQAPTKGVDSGAFGKMREIESCKMTSYKRGVAKEWVNDGFFTLDGVRTGFEYKTNGGRVGKIVNSLENGKDGYIVYEMNVCNSTTQGKQRVVFPVIMTYSMFMDLLETSGALRTNSRDGEPCIQVSNKKFYERLLDYPLEFDNDQKYTIDDFDGLEI